MIYYSVTYPCLCLPGSKCKKHVIMLLWPWWLVYVTTLSSNIITIIPTTSLCNLWLINVCVSLEDFHLWCWKMYQVEESLTLYRSQMTWLSGGAPVAQPSPAPILLVHLPPAACFWSLAPAYVCPAQPYIPLVAQDIGSGKTHSLLSMPFDCFELTAVPAGYRPKYQRGSPEIQWKTYMDPYQAAIWNFHTWIIQKFHWLSLTLFVSHRDGPFSS